MSALTVSAVALFAVNVISHVLPRNSIIDNLYHLASPADKLRSEFHVYSTASSQPSTNTTGTFTVSIVIYA